MTPPREAGLLADVFRAEPLARGEIVERSLRPGDVRNVSSALAGEPAPGPGPIRLAD